MATSSVSSEKYTLDIFAIVILILMIVLIVFLIVVLIYIRRVAEFRIPSSSESNFLFWVGVVILVILVIVAIVAIVRLFTHKTTVITPIVTTTVVPQTMPTMTMSTPTPTIYSAPQPQSGNITTSQSFTGLGTSPPPVSTSPPPVVLPVGTAALSFQPAQLVVTQAPTVSTNYSTAAPALQTTIVNQPVPSVQPPRTSSLPNSIPVSGVTIPSMSISSTGMSPLRRPSVSPTTPSFLSTNLSQSSASNQVQNQAVAIDLFGALGASG